MAYRRTSLQPQLVGHNQTVSKISLDEIKAFHDDHYGPRHVIVMVGAVNGSDAVQRFAPPLGDWQNPSQPATNFATVPRFSEVKRDYIAFPVIAVRNCDGCLVRRVCRPISSARMANNISAYSALRGDSVKPCAKIKDSPIIPAVAEWRPGTGTLAGIAGVNPTMFNWRLRVCCAKSNGSVMNW